VSDPLRDTALLLVDLQYDFLERTRLQPEPEWLCARAAALLAAARSAGVAVAHAHTVVRADGSDRMPHWKRDGVWQCVEGSRGAAPPPALIPAKGELVARKQYFSAFGDARLDSWLRQRGVRRLIVAGLYLQSCVRATALDAYERGYEVVLADDAIGTTEPLHAELTRAYLAARSAEVRSTAALIAELGNAVAIQAQAVFDVPAAVISGERRRAAGATVIVHRAPCRRDEVLTEVPQSGAAEVAAAARTCDEARPSWARSAAKERAALLDRWASEIEAGRTHLVDLVIRETGKPRRFAEEEIGRAAAHARIAGALAVDPARQTRSIAAGVAAAARPLGVVGLITPWNNAVAIPVGKIAPALAFGNAVVFKPAPQASAVALALLECLERGGVPAGLVNAVFGGADSARAVCREPNVTAVSVTGSLATGRAVAACCAERMIPLQAELGGNNAALVLADADLEAAAASLARAAFGFAGQRCTAIRRFVVERPVLRRFTELVRAATAALANGDPGDAATEVGPLISADKRDDVRAAIERAVAAGAKRLIGGEVPRGREHGAWLEPALLGDVDPQSRIAQEELFGPVAVILEARDLDDALAIGNAVPHGLVFAAHTSDAKARARVLETAQAGIVQLGSGPLLIHPHAPFSGWKASGLGPPEHGVWDADFYSRVQAVYGGEA